MSLIPDFVLNSLTKKAKKAAPVAKKEEPKKEETPQFNPFARAPRTPKAATVVAEKKAPAPVPAQPIVQGLRRVVFLSVPDKASFNCACGSGVCPGALQLPGETVEVTFGLEGYVAQTVQVGRDQNRVKVLLAKSEAVVEKLAEALAEPEKPAKKSKKAAK